MYDANIHFGWKHALKRDKCCYDLTNIIETDLMLRLWMTETNHFLDILSKLLMNVSIIWWISAYSFFWLIFITKAVKLKRFKSQRYIVSYI